MERSKGMWTEGMIWTGGAKRRTPESIYIAPHTFEVRELPPTQMDSSLYGSFEGAPQVILVSSVLSDTMIAETLAHEIFHGIIHLSGIASLFESPEREEPIVQALGTHWCQVLRDNPKLLAMFKNAVGD